MQEVQYPNGDIKREFFTGYRDRDIHEEMDRRLIEQKAEGGTLVRRTKIGRNATCPCGSERKFKKCCIDGAQRVGVGRC